MNKLAKNINHSFINHIHLRFRMRKLVWIMNGPSKGHEEAKALQLDGSTGIGREGIKPRLGEEVLDGLTPHL